jgi:hypothetical protein
MHDTARRWLGKPLAFIATAALLAACGDNSTLGPDYSGSRARVADVAANTGLDNRVPDLPAGCERLRAADGSVLALKVFGIGVQTYRWDGTTWKFVAPTAKLFADANYNGLVGNHFGGPTWKTLSGSTVVGSVSQRCQPDPNSIQWLLLDVVSNTGSGAFLGVTQIQRLTTIGGNAPSTPGDAVGQTVDVPYTSDYLFYRPAPSNAN